VGFVAFLNHWWNLPFLVALGLVGVFFVLQIVGLFGDHDGDHDADHDADGDHDADHDADGSTASWHEVLAFFGVGRVPFMVVWVTLFLFGGFSGIFLNRVVFVWSQGQYALWHFILVAFVSLVVALAAVRVFSRVAARFVDTGGRGAAAKHELAGRMGVVASPVVDARFGEIRVVDAHGNEQIVHGRMQDGEASLQRDAKVVLVEFDPKTELFWVTKGDF
jgi:hypothetical protein